MSRIDRLVGQVIASGALSKAEKAKRRVEAAEARGKMKRIERERLRIAAAAEIWEDREGKARPTPQRKLKGVFSLSDGDDAGVSVASDSASCTLDALAVRGDRDFTAADVAIYMAALKLIRASSNPSVRDSFVDAVGYSAIAGELAAEGLA